MVGRPTKYTPELLERAAQYIAVYEDEGDVIPSAVGLADYLGITRSTLYAWQEDEDKGAFSDILDEIMRTQERVLVSKGLTGDFNSTITKLILTKHNYSDKVDNTLSGPDGGAIPVSNVTRTIVKP